MTHGFKNGRVIAEQGTIERTGVGEFLKFDDGTDNFQTFSSNGSPEGVIAADKGSIAHDITGTCLYFKTTDTVNTGWECLAATGGVAGSGITFLASATASASATVEFTSLIDSTYNMYLIVWEDVKPATDNVDFHFRTSSDGGVSFDSGASDYSYYLETSGTLGATFIKLSSGSRLGNDTNEKADGFMFLMNPSAASYTTLHSQCMYLGVTTNFIKAQVSGIRNSAADVDAIQFLMSSGNIASGTFKLYGFVTPS